MTDPLDELMKAHEALLNTLGASKHPWITKVYRNANAYYQTWRKSMPEGNLRGEAEKNGSSSNSASDSTLQPKGVA